MSFSQVIGASSAIRPGVVTSSTRPSVPFDGQLIYETDTDRLAQYNGSAWVTQNGLQLLSTTTIGSAVSSVTVSNAFSATYDNYVITVSGGTPSAADRYLMTLGSTATGYYGMVTTHAYSSGTLGGTQYQNATSWTHSMCLSTAGSTGVIQLFNPFNADETTFFGNSVQIGTALEVWWTGGYLNNTTSYTSFTLAPNTGTVTGGTIRVYGYANN